MSNEMNDITDSQIIYFGICKDAKDPLMLGRVRVIPESENLESMLGTIQGFNENSNSLRNGPWSDKDPLIFFPLLPYFINQVPIEGERVLLLYFNNKIKRGKNKFYMVGPYSSPMDIGYEDYRSSRTHTSSGYQNSRKNIPNIKIPKTKSYANSNNAGVFPEPEDISINGRGTSDLILKNNDVLLRAGKHKDFKSGEIPEYDDNRAFIQLTKLTNRLTYGDPESFIRAESQEKQLKFLIEYDVYNPESAPQIFRGDITIYQLPDKESKITKTNVFEWDTDLDGVTLPKFKLIKIDDPLDINQFTKFVSDTILSFKDESNLNEQFPFYFRPSNNIRKIVKSQPNQNNILEFTNMNQLMSKIIITTTDVSPGYGLILDQKVSNEIPFLLKREVYVPITTTKIDNTVGLIGASQLYLLSHDSEIPEKGKISLPGSVSGINSTQIFDEIEPKTSSMVRGEELLDLLESIVGFLVSHVHPYPLLPPSATSYDGTSIDELLKKMLESYQKVLNSNIRIN